MLWRTLSALLILNRSTLKRESYVWGFIGDRLAASRSGILSLVSLGGIHWMGSARLPFGMGFTVRDVDAIVMTGVKVHVMHKELMELRNLAREKIVMESERRRETRRRRSATRPNIVSSMLRTKLIIHERNKAMVGIKQRARSDFAHEFIRRWGPLDDDALQSVLFTTKMTYPDASWRIGSFEIVNMMVSLYGNQMHLNSYKTCGFVGDTDALSTHLGMNVLQEMIGPRHAMKQVRGEFVNGSRQIMKDISTFTSSVAREIRALNVRKHIVKTFCKSPAKKGRYKAARSSSTLDERHDVKEATVKMEQDRHEAEVDSCGECKVEPPNANSSDARL